MAKHLPSVTWLLRPLGVHPNGYVCTLDRSNLEIALDVEAAYQSDRLWLALPRRDARLLAKRILQCLEDTK